MRRFLFGVCLLFATLGAVAQPSGERIAARANVAAYDDENALEKLLYRESPYFLELSDAWKQQRTDSSVVYIRQLDVEKTWKDYLVFLNVRAGRACRVYIDNKGVIDPRTTFFYRTDLSANFAQYYEVPKNASNEDKMNISQGQYIIYDNDSSFNILKTHNYVEVSSKTPSSCTGVT